MNIYIDVRGSQPMLIVGMLVIELKGCDRGITPVEGLIWVRDNRPELDQPFDLHDNIS